MDADWSTVTLARPFLMKTTEVTQGEWHFIMGQPSESYDKACGDDCAVGYVSWRRALDYLRAVLNNGRSSLAMQFAEKSV